MDITVAYSGTSVGIIRAAPTIGVLGLAEMLRGLPGGGKTGEDARVEIAPEVVALNLETRGGFVGG